MTSILRGIETGAIRFGDVSGSPADKIPGGQRGSPWTLELKPRERASVRTVGEGREKADTTTPVLSGFNSLIGLEIVEMGPDRVVATLDAGPRHQQPYGIVHGGVHCTLVETLASTGAALWAMSEGLAGVIGISNSTDFLRSHRQGPLTAEGTPIHRGRTYQIWQVEVVRDSDGKVVARGQVRLQNLESTDLIGGITPPGDFSAKG